MTLAVIQERPLDVDDLEELPDDGNRYELLDGFLLVSPAPAIPHQLVIGGLHVLLRQAAPRELAVLLAPTDWRVDRRNSFQPDLLVARRTDLGHLRLEVVPLLAVEVLSPGTRIRDLTLKRAAYERAGVPSYWVVDPLRPSLTVLQLQDGHYHDVAAVTGEEVFEAVEPYPVTIVPARLGE